MISANKAFKSQIRKVNYADIILRDGTVLNLEPSDFILGGFSMTDETTTGKFGVGIAVGKTISLTINNHTNKFSMYDFYKAMIYMYVSVTLEDGTVLKERKGKYYVINPTSPGDVITLSGVDSMHLFDRPYSSSTAYPTTLQVILSECCLDCGVNFGFKQFENYDFVVEKKPEECTYRQVVSWVAQIAGYNARISNNDYLELVWYDTSLIDQNILDGGKFFDYSEEDIYDGGDFTTYTDNILWDGGNFTDPAPENVTRIKSISVSTDDVVITGVMVKYDDKEILEGEEGYYLTISDNDLVAGKESEIAQYLGNKLIGLRFRPLSCQIANNPLFEPYDIAYVYDRKGNAYFTLINSVTYSISGFTTIACKAEDPIRNESSYVSKEAQAIVKARKEAKEELSNYDKAVQNMNMLAANAMGLFREYEEKTDSSVIYYMSNRPITKNENGVCEFALNSVVYKMTGDGFFVSEDGGKSYTGGFDANMNAVVNVLYAIGISFDWAHGGTLTLGGKDNANGILNVLDKDGKVVGKWDNTGITLPPGTTISWTQITDNDKVANKNDIPTDNKQLNNGAGYTTKIDVNSIITERVTASFVNALNVKAGSVDAENITGTYIKGKTIDGGTVKGTTIEGGSIKIGSLFEVDLLGNAKANSLTSTNAKITGGEIAGFSISGSSIRKSKTSINDNSSGIYIGTDGINIGYNSAFKVTDQGDVTIGPIGSLTIDYRTKLTFSSGYNSIEYDGIYLGSDRATHLKSGELKIGGSYNYYTIITQNKITFGSGSDAYIVKGSTNMIAITSSTTSLFNSVILGGSSGKVGFFSNEGSTKKSVSTITSTSSATASTNATKINEIINALKAYNLM